MKVMVFLAKHEDVIFEFCLFNCFLVGCRQFLIMAIVPGGTTWVAGWRIKPQIVSIGASLCRCLGEYDCCYSLKFIATV